MLVVGSALKDIAVMASDGGVGTVSDILFDDTTFMMRWLVVDAGSWLTDRKVLIHPSAIKTGELLRGDLRLGLTMAQVRASPDIDQHQPVSRQMEASLYGFYGLDPFWTGGYLGPGMMSSPLVPLPLLQDAGRPGGVDSVALLDEPDPHLRSLVAVTGYHVHATDGGIGHIENMLVEDADWSIRYLIVDTRNWWPGRHVLISPQAIGELNWAERLVRLDVTRAKVEASPAWDPLDRIDTAYEKQLHGHYGWAG
jgi:hypothetical protein